MKPVLQITGIALVLLQWVCAASAAEESDTLLRLVGPEAGLVIEVSDLAEHLPAFKESEFFERLQELDIYQQWVGSEHFQKLLHARTAVEQLTGRPFGRTIMDLFGESFVLAVYPQTETGAAGVLLTRTTGVDVMKSTLQAWNRAEPHQTDALDYRGQLYYARKSLSPAEGEAATVYYTRFGRDLALSDSEQLIRQVIDLSRAHAAADSGDRIPESERLPSLVDSEKFQTAKSSLSPGSMVTAYFDPRGWDGILDYEPTGTYQQRALCAIWRRCQSIAAGVRMRHGPVVEVVLHYDGAHASPGWDRFIQRATGPAEFVEHIPQHALAALAGRHHLGGLKNLIPEFLPQSISRQWDNYRATAKGLLLGLDPFDDVLRRLEPNWGAYIVARPEAEPEQGAPLDGLVAFELPDEAADAARSGQVPLRRALENGLSASLNLMALYWGDSTSPEPPVVRSEVRSGTTINWVEGIGAYRPAYALGEKYVLIATNPDTIAECLATDSRQSLAADARFQEARQYYAGGNQIIYVDVAALRTLLAENRECFIQQAARAHALPADVARSQLAQIEDVLQVVDTAFLGGNINESRVKLVAGGIVAEVAPTAAEGR